MIRFTVFERDGLYIRITGKCFFSNTFYVRSFYLVGNQNIFVVSGIFCDLQFIGAVDLVFPVIVIQNGRQVVCVVLTG